ncbi:protein takeout-like [Lucilia sericata]|uniref:protein takeout-like n=1 Tax=Lucilia sericata TaxID=13632 RepID=UPI0018A8346C|nr:protein takeout-like [Lucilia sericata]XP_037825493.1 protein takeout-like [Lucilia sericata]
MGIKFLLVHMLILIGSLKQAVGSLPPEVEKCKSTDNDECIIKNIMKIMKLYPHGYPEIGLPEFASITVKDVVLSSNKQDSPIHLNFKFNTVTITGTDKQQILRAHGFNKNLTQTIELDFFAPELKIDGDYEMEGKLLVLPLNGKGVGNIVMKDVTTKYKIKIKLENRNNKLYGVIDKMKLWMLEPKKITLNLQNIVNNNDVLTKTVNEVINENWSDIWKELESNTMKLVEDNFRRILSDIISTLPVDEFYAD